MIKRFALAMMLCVGLLLSSCSAGVSGLKAYVDSIDGYEFLYPNGWIPVQVSSAVDVVFRDLIEPTENVSVVVNPVALDQNLKDLGSPEDLGQRLAKSVIAPANSGRDAELVGAEVREFGQQTYYNLEYLIRPTNGSTAWSERHNLTSVAISHGKLYTLSVSAPSDRWARVNNLFHQMVSSFVVY